MQATLNKSILIGLAAIALSLGFAFSAYADDGSWNNDWNKWDHNNRDKQECNQGNWEWSGWNWWWNDCDSDKHNFNSSVGIRIGGHDFDHKDSDWQSHNDNDGHDWKSWDDKSDKDWKDNDWKDGNDGRDGKDGKDGWDGGDNRW